MIVFLVLQFHSGPKQPRGQSHALQRSGLYTAPCDTVRSGDVLPQLTQRVCSHQPQSCVGLHQTLWPASRGAPRGDGDMKGARLCCTQPLGVSLPPSLAPKSFIYIYLYDIYIFIFIIRETVLSVVNICNCVPDGQFITLGLSTAWIFHLLSMKSCLRGPTLGPPGTASFPSTSQHLPHLVPHLGITQSVMNIRSVQISCGKRNKRKEGKTNEMEIEAFHWQKVQHLDFQSNHWLLMELPFLLMLVSDHQQWFLLWEWGASL